jgi:ATP-dependent Clp protease ATP-binding subunit ClpA
VDAVVEKTQREVMDLLRKTVRPEFLNRVDELIMFRPLSQKDVREIVKLQLHMLLAKLEEKDIHLHPQRGTDRPHQHPPASIRSSVHAPSSA